MNDVPRPAVILALLLLSVVGIILAVHIARRPFRGVPIERVHDFLEALLKRGRNGAVVIVTAIHSQTFLQFEKYIRPQQEIGLVLSFPRAPWSHGHYKDVKAVLAARGVIFRTTPVDSAPTSEFLDVDFGQNVDLAYAVAQDVFLNVFKLPKPCRVNIETSRISTKDGLITQ